MLFLERGNLGCVDVRVHQNGLVGCLRNNMPARHDSVAARAVRVTRRVPGRFHRVNVGISPLDNCFSVSHGRSSDLAPPGRGDNRSKRRPRVTKHKAGLAAMVKMQMLEEVDVTTNDANEGLLGQVIAAGLLQGGVHGDHGIVGIVFIVAKPPERPVGSHETALGQGLSRPALDFVEVIRIDVGLFVREFVRNGEPFIGFHQLGGIQKKQLLVRHVHVIRLGILTAPTFALPLAPVEEAEETLAHVLASFVVATSRDPDCFLKQCLCGSEKISIPGIPVVTEWVTGTTSVSNRACRHTVHIITQMHNHFRFF
mmetsp:Transcript_1230/g.2736  ORF Transcript_1230/g.2736 Transcript_1230/m.2736 type:complete len:312 (+) Transcript_1230:236-1171(+)